MYCCAEAVVKIWFITSSLFLLVFLINTCYGGAGNGGLSLSLFQLFLFIPFTPDNLPVNDKPACQQEEEHQAGSYPLEVVVDSPVRVHVQHCKINSVVLKRVKYCFI